MSALQTATPAPAFRNAKYEATGETKNWLGTTLHRIRAVADIAAIGVVAGQLGGWIEVYGDAQVSGNAWVSGNAQVSGDDSLGWFSKVGSENGTLTWFLDAKGTIYTNRGCFSGTLDQFEAAVAKRHGDSQTAQEYRLLIEFIRLRAAPAIAAIPVECAA